MISAAEIRVEVPMKVVQLRDVEKAEVTMEGAHRASKQVPLSKTDGAPHFSFRVFTLEGGGHTPYHSHESEHLNYVIEGEGALVDGAGREQELKAGSFAMVLPNEKHQYRNTGKAQPLVFLCAVPIAYE